MMYNNHWSGGWENLGPGVGNPFIGELLVWAAPVLVVIVLWSIFWKGLALWHAGRRAQTWWFVALLIFNTMGILDIIYLFFVAKLTLDTLFSKDAGVDQRQH